MLNLKVVPLTWAVAIPVTENSLSDSSHVTVMLVTGVKMRPWTVNVCENSTTVSPPACPFTNGRSENCAFEMHVKKAIEKMVRNALIILEARLESIILSFMGVYILIHL